MANPGSSQRSELSRVLWAFRREFFVIGLFSMVANVLMLMPTIYMLQVFDRVLMSRSELTLLFVSLITLFLYGMMAVAEWSRSRVLVRASVRLDAVLASRVYNAAFEASLSQSGARAQRAFADLAELRQFITGNGALTFFDAPWAPIYVAVLFLLHPLLGWFAVVVALLQAALAWFGHRRLVEPAQEVSEALGEVNNFMQSKLRNAEAVESMGMFGNLGRRWSRLHQLHMGRHAHLQGRTHRITAFSKWLRYCQQSLGLGAGALLVVQGQMTAGAMIAANALTSRALAPIDQIVGTWRGFLNARLAYRRLQALLDAHPARDPALSRMPPEGQVTLIGVGATAEGRAAPILSDISLQAEPGTVTVILGPSGSGKSTLARVLVGIWPQVSGEVLLDGRPLAGWDRAELGPSIGYLPQDIELFDGSISENIARFAEIDPAKVIAAARGTGLHEMILRLPKGYETPIGEGGGRLSGGQRQRLGLARAMYGNPRVVVLDEPNANLDEAGEAALLEAVRTMKAAGSTVFLITHRAGVLQLADQVIVLRAGRIHLSGSRDSVLARLQAAARPAEQAAAGG
ncbi:MAG: type I secretion system permease/ATPase [Burkholderiaceae bacterium]